MIEYTKRQTKITSLYSGLPTKYETVKTTATVKK